MPELSICWILFFADTRDGCCPLSRMADPALSIEAERRSWLRAFTILHVPLYVLLLWFLWRSDGSNRNLMVGLDVFFIVHTFLHILLRNLPRNQFKTLFSWIHIAGAGIAGVIDLLF